MGRAQGRGSGIFNPERQHHLPLILPQIRTHNSGFVPFPGRALGQFSASVSASSHQPPSWPQDFSLVPPNLSSKGHPEGYFGKVYLIMCLSWLKPLKGYQSSQDEVKGLCWGPSRPLQPGPAGHDQSSSPPCVTQTPSCQPHTPSRQEPRVPSNARLCALLGSSHKAAPTWHTAPCIKGLPDPRGPSFVFKM